MSKIAEKAKKRNSLRFEVIENAAYQQTIRIFEIRNGKKAYLKKISNDPSKSRTAGKVASEISALDDQITLVYNILKYLKISVEERQTALELYELARQDADEFRNLLVEPKKELA